ncbi:MAG: lytic transglycosylase domain-containing protein [Bacteroidota bacterium]
MKAVSVYALVLTVFCGVLFFSSNLNKQAGMADQEFDKEIQTDNNSLPQIIQGVRLIQGINLGDEELPMDNFDAKERLEREFLVNSYWHSSTLLYLKNANRYFPVIEPILAEQGVPDDFKYLAVAESALRNVKSPAGARGIWQFMSASGKSYGLVINDEVDERYHLEKATVAACKYLKDAKAELGSWTMAAASYNMGVPRLKSNMQEQKETNYYHLNLNPETSRYVFRVMAIKEIMTRPRDFGFYLAEDELYAPLDNYSIVTVDGPVKSWGDFAQQYGTNYRMLKVYNPWLRKSSLTNREGRTYQVKIPR